MSNIVIDSLIKEKNRLVRKLRQLQKELSERDCVHSSIIKNIEDVGLLMSRYNEKRICDKIQSLLDERKRLESLYEKDYLKMLNGIFDVEQEIEYVEKEIIREKFYFGLRRR